MDRLGGDFAVVAAESDGQLVVSTAGDSTMAPRRAPRNVSGAEQIVALEDELYSAHHVILHLCLVGNLALTGLNVPSPLAAGGIKTA